MVSGTWSNYTRQLAERISDREDSIPDDAESHLPAPDPIAFSELLDEFAPFGPAPLVPEVSVFQGLDLLELWNAAERLAGTELPPPYWGYPWAGGVALARYLLDHHDLVRGARVLDLGAGGGVTALAALRAGAGEVVINDWDPWALLTAELAAARQGAELIPIEGDLTIEGRGSSHWARYDVVLSGDLSYDREVSPRIHALLATARAAGALVLVADAGRAYFDPAGFTLEFECTVPVPRDLEGTEERVARVYLMD